MGLEPIFLTKGGMVQVNRPGRQSGKSSRSKQNWTVIIPKFLKQSVPQLLLDNMQLDEQKVSYVGGEVYGLGWGEGFIFTLRSVHAPVIRR